MIFFHNHKALESNPKDPETFNYVGMYCFFQADIKLYAEFPKAFVNHRTQKY